MVGEGDLPRLLPWWCRETFIACYRDARGRQGTGLLNIALRARHLVPAVLSLPGSSYVRRDRGKHSWPQGTEGTWVS